MIYDTTNNGAKLALLKDVNDFIDIGALVEVKKRSKTRTIAQNDALHLYFEFIANALNEIGQEFCYDGFKGVKISTMYTPFLIKELMWRPIQMVLFGKESTTELTTKEMNEIIDVITKFFAEKGVEVSFPSLQIQTK